MDQQAQALDALQQVATLEQGIDSTQANSKSNGQAVPVNQSEVCVTCVLSMVHLSLKALSNRASTTGM